MNGNAAAGEKPFRIAADEVRATSDKRQATDLFAGFVVKAVVQVDVRLAVVTALVLLIVCLAVGFVQAARSIRKEHEVRFSRIQRRLERDAAAIVDQLFRRD